MLYVHYSSYKLDSQSRETPSEKLRLLVKHLIKKLGGIEVPVQLIQAKNDDMTSVKNSQFIYGRIKSAKKEIVLLHNSYHVITADQERTKVAQNVLDFFSKSAVLQKQVPLIGVNASIC